MAMPSTVIRRFDYSPDRRELLIEFVSGRRYVYADVSEQTVQELRSASSRGSYFDRHIRDRYPCREVVAG